MRFWLDLNATSLYLVDNLLVKTARSISLHISWSLRLNRKLFLQGCHKSVGFTSHECESTDLLQQTFQLFTLVFFGYHACTIAIKVESRKQNIFSPFRCARFYLLKGKNSWWDLMTPQKNKFDLFFSISLLSLQNLVKLSLFVYD